MRGSRFCQMVIVAAVAAVWVLGPSGAEAAPRTETGSYVSLGGDVASRCSGGDTPGINIVCFDDLEGDETWVSIAIDDVSGQRVGASILTKDAAGTWNYLPSYLAICSSGRVDITGALGMRVAFRQAVNYLDCINRPFAEPTEYAPAIAGTITVTFETAA